MATRPKPVVLIVLDGWGYSETKEHNSIALAKTPFYDYLWQTYPHTVLDASEEKVGLPAGQMGNSEIGHMTIGAGKILATDLVRIARSIKDKSWHDNPAFLEVFAHVKKNNSTLHVLGLVSPGGVHSHMDHLVAFLESAKKYGLTKVAIHAFTDGRDTPPQSAGQYLADLEDVLERLGIGYIATASGRFYAMDRDKNWDRLKKAEDALFECRGKVCALKKPSIFFKEMYQAGQLDEHTEPVIFADQDGKTYPVQDNDGLFFFNFRSDRARMLSERVLKQAKQKNLCFVTMTQYDKTFTCSVAFPPETVDTTLAAEIARAGLLQSHIAETEKYPHATYFLNGGQEEPHMGELHIMVDSRKDVPTHDLAPLMRAEGIADKAIEQINKGDDFIFINFANADMVGHTANQPALIQAVEEVDKQLRRVVEKVLQAGGAVCITADHGNAELNIDPVTGEKHTAHTTNLVPFIMTQENKVLAQGGTLADVAPTVLELMDLPIPAVMTGKSLITVR